MELQERQIEDVRENLRKTQQEGTNSIERGNEISTLKIIKEELENLSRNNDVSKLSNAIDILSDSIEKKY